MLRAAGTLVVCTLLLLLACAVNPEESPGGWYQGNTHTHTLWSDGDGSPDQVAAWYRDHGYHFLVLSDHNVLAEGERWFAVSADDSGRLSESHVADLIANFGEDAVVTRDVAQGREMRLPTLTELRARFEKPEEFLFVPGEEITTSWRREGEKPVDYAVHVNAINTETLIPPPRGASVVDVMNQCVDAVVEEGRAAGRPVLAHVNHPNFGWGISWEDLARVKNDRFFEVLNGHRGVRNHGDGEHPGTEEMWDLANVLRLCEFDLPLLYAVATDDAHHYHGKATAQPGRGWIVVRAAELSGNALVTAMQAGDFYASTGVTLADVARDPVGEEGEYRVTIEAEEGVVYTTRFVGTRVTAEGPGEVGEVLAETTANPAVYRYRGDELYVRATVVASREHPNPFAAGDRETAWTQPVGR